MPSNGSEWVVASRLVNRNITASNGRTSMRLEPEVWDALREICLREGTDLRDLIQQIEKNADAGGRTSAVRVYVLTYFRAAATDDGHRSAGHAPRQIAAKHDGNADGAVDGEIYS